ncbi:MAG: hypothetical protein IJW85_03535 [Clostridia bacterium]|nr:hypothetical protein [Clostridia bacterium]
MNLEAYRKKVQRRLVWMRVLAVVFVVVELVGSRFVLDGNASNYVWGLCVGGGFMALVVLFQQSKALKDDEKLRKMYIEEHDERQQAIRAKAGQPMVIYLSLGLAMTAAVVSFFNEVVAATLALAAAAQCLVSLVVKLVCMKRM